MNNKNIIDKQECRYIIVNAWQMQCCGKPFKVGSTVKWFVTEWDDEDLLVDVGNIDFYYEHHGDDDTQLLKIKGDVVSIVAIYYDYEKSEKFNLMIPHSGIAIEVKKADGWDKEFEGKELFCYYVCLENICQLPMPEKMYK